MRTGKTYAAINKPNRAQRRANRERLLKKIKRLHLGRQTTCSACGLHHMAPTATRCQCKVD